MIAKFLLIAISAAALSSCSTAYKSGQTPDDVYYSPVRMVDESDNTKKEETKQQDRQVSVDEARIRMQIRDRRWRDLDYDYDYDYSYSPYYYSYNTYNNYGYYYNPYYCSRPLYYPKVTAAAPVNTTPRMVNLNSYKNYNTVTRTDPKTGASTITRTNTRPYNNSNNGGSKVGNVLREILVPSNNSSSNNNNNTPSTNNNNTRTYTPAPSNNNSGSSGSSSGSSSGGSVSRPGRG